MSLGLDNSDVDRLARELAEMTGESLEKAVIRSLRERIDRVQASDQEEKKRRAERILEHGRRFRALPVIDPRSGP